MTPSERSRLEAPVGPLVHPAATVDPGAELAPGVSVGPHAVIAAHTRIGAGTRIKPCSALTTSSWPSMCALKTLMSRSPATFDQSAALRATF